MSFVHLHLHTTFSFGDGACRIDEVVARAVELGMEALAVTDHEGLYGAVRFYQACQKAGLRPIVGVELTVEPVLGRDGRPRPPAAPGDGHEPRAAATRGPEGGSGGGRSRTEAAQRPPEGPLAPVAAGPHTPAMPGHDGAGIAPLRGPATVPPAAARHAGGHHLVLLALDAEGWSQLCRIITAAHLEHPGEPPCARIETLAANASHLVALSGCRRGEVWSRLLAGDREGARRAALAYRDLFGERFFVELQHELRPDSGHWLRLLDALARDLGLPTVATNDVHYTVPADAPLHDVLAAEAAGLPLPNPLGRTNAELYLKSPGQMRRLFRRYPEAYANAARIADRCRLDLGLGRFHFPACPLPPGETAASLLRARCLAGARERYGALTPAVSARLEHELRVIEELGFAEYFLAVHDIVRFARERGILYSGRGSAGNSIVSYVLRITDADPLEHGLLFERFLNPARREMPDVDLDFDARRRDEVIRFIYDRFGHDRVAMVATVNTVRAPSAVRIISRAFGFPPAEVDRLSRRVPWGSAARLGEMLAERPELARHEFRHPHYRRLVDLAERLDGFPTHLGTHLGGFILSRDPLTDRVPLQWAARGVVVAQFDKDDVETLGLVKMDILSLRMHAAIAETVARVAARTGRRLDPWQLPRDDPAVYELIRSGRTVGVFQLESSGQRNLAMRLQQRCFDDIVAAISLFRPGPLQAEMIGPFIRRRHGREPATVPHPDLWPILRDTYGVILYQEQVIQVAAAIAGFSLAEADLLRRAMTHDRSLEEMDAIGRRFVARAVARGVDREVAAEVFRQLRGFAAYGFNKAHAVCFAIVCAASAWLKAHYPAEFACAILNNQPMGFYSPRVVLNDARRSGIAVLPVDVNRSGERFEVEDDGRAIRVGLACVKEMSAAERRAIVAARGGAATAPAGAPGPPGPPRPYRSLADFVARTGVSREVTANLVRVGAFDGLGVRREELLAQLPLVYGGRWQRPPAGTAGGDQPRLPLDDGLPPLPFLPSWTLAQRLQAELEVLGLNVSAHPLSLFREPLRQLGVTPFADLPRVPHGRRVRLAGVLERAQMPWVRSGHRTLFLTLEDESGLAQVVVFNDVYLRYGAVVKDAVYLYVEGVLQNDEEHGLAVVAHRLADLTVVAGGAAGVPAPEPRTRLGRTG